MDNSTLPDTLTSNTSGSMKWYGWGAEGTGFDADGRPHLIPYAIKHLDIDPERAPDAPVDLSSIDVPACRISSEVWTALEQALPNGILTNDDFDRLCHAYGRSTRDIWRLRHGWIERAPDAVAFPTDEAHLETLTQLATQHGLVLVPFGGGSNVAGCLESYPLDEKPSITVNMRRMNALLDIDKVSGTARIQAGILGPDLEKALSKHGFTFGHFPDSFHHSTLGGWVSTRSSGMMSDGYGNAEDRVLAARLVAPTGTIATALAPHSSTGPDVHRLLAGSEGSLGMISELTVSVRAKPEVQAYSSMLFRSFEEGIEAMRQLRLAGIVPVACRLNDRMKTSLSAAFRRVSGPEGPKDKLGKAVLRHLYKLDLDSVCLMVVVYEGSASAVAHQKRAADRILKAHRAVSVGDSPAKALLEGKFDLPHIRDFLMQHAVITDVAETCTTWAKVPGLVQSGKQLLREKLTRENRAAWIGCHISHTYPAGCSIYFTFAFRCLCDDSGWYDPEVELEHYLSAKHAILNHFSENGATVSHHHALGYEHIHWLKSEMPFGGGSVIEAAKAAVDPNGIMNPARHYTGDQRS